MHNRETGSQLIYRVLPKSLPRWKMLFLISESVSTYDIFCDKVQGLCAIKLKIQFLQVASHQCKQYELTNIIPKC